MTPLPFVWPYALIFWGLFFGFYSVESKIVNRAKAAVKQEGSLDGGSLQVIMFGGGIASVVGFWLAWFMPMRFPSSMALTCFVVGTLVLVAGSLLRRHCFRMLGISFTGDVRVPEKPVVISSGAYKYLRHPSYTGGILMNLGIGLALGSWGSLLLLAVAAFAVYAYRIKVEERVLVEGLGEPYREFIRTRKRMIPFVY